jgi:hypothetical protein
VIHASYFFKLLIHPTPLADISMLWQRAAIGPIPGQAVVIVTVAFGGGLLLLALLTMRNVRAAGRVGNYLTKDEILQFDAD